MTTQVKAHFITMRAARPVQLEAGVTLPPGEYRVEEKQLGVPAFGGQVAWMDPEYKITLTAPLLAKIGVDPGNFLSVEYEVTKFVRTGEFTRA